MRVVKASYAGACYGVQRALDMAVEASASGEGASTSGRSSTIRRWWPNWRRAASARSTAPRTSSAAR